MPNTNVLAPAVEPKSSVPPAAAVRLPICWENPFRFSVPAEPIETPPVLARRSLAPSCRLPALMFVPPV